MCFVQKREYIGLPTTYAEEGKACPCGTVTTAELAARYEAAQLLLDAERVLAEKRAADAPSMERLRARLDSLNQAHGVAAGDSRD